jgi:hypothetical protein
LVAGQGGHFRFFSPGSIAAPDYLNPDNTNYSPKLAAAVNAWLAVTSDSKYQDNGKSVKANVINWLTANAAQYSLERNDGSINSSAVNDQIAPVVNFDPKGGAPSTPEPKLSPLNREPTPPEDEDFGDIPF